ncbi:hypothetical protein PV08_05188 [Exophiala spinifera]|uniref:alpha-galactosidase n=1 Tax=Exophiala spinifera TaxID=91928 RepID=A0A0D2B8A4_9EURO|nr:uncharacterized protein PV08_05188 [Exophiala spinifera]KIW15143.1 hypothetical protein PV08_05188 [Exophiala spinifera]
MPNLARFPDGIKGLADKIQDMDLKLGIYSTAGNATCAGYSPSLGFEDVDATDLRLGVLIVSSTPTAMCPEIGPVKI